MAEVFQSATEIAKLLMLSERRVRQLVEQGVLPKEERGRYALVPCIQAYIKFLRDRAIGGDISEAGDDKARLLKAKADIAEMQAKETAGVLVRTEQVEQVWTEAVSRFRQRVLAVPSKAAPLTAVEVETEACHEIIETYLHEALAELSAGQVDGSDATGEGDAGDVDGSGAAAEAEDIGVGG